MVQDPRRPPDNGKLKTTGIGPGMNRIPPGKATASGKGANGDDKLIPLVAGDEKPNAKEDAKLLARARKRFDTCVDKEAENRKEGLLDDKFLAGQQWPADIQAQRNTDQRPCLTINKLPTFVNQVTNEQRIDRPAINVSPIGDRADVEVAKMLRGLIRFFDRESYADNAYDTAFASSASKGFGYWRTLTDWVSPESFDQTIVVERILNAFEIYLDPQSTEPDGADAKYGFKTIMIPRSEFEEQYPDADPMSWTESGAGDTFKNWVDDKNVRMAEYYEIEYEKRRLVALSNGHLGWYDELDPAVLDDIDDGRIEIDADRESECPAVKWYKLTAVEILDRRDWPGSSIPIVKVIGNEINIEGKTQYSGVVRNARDPQRVYNYSVTAEMEVVALAPKAPWLLAEGQDEGWEDEWLQANTKSFPALHYKPTSLAGNPLPPPQRQPPGQPAAGWEALKQGAAQDMMATTGIRFDATLQERTVDESGRALREIKRTTDLTTFHYQDNLCRSLKRQGDIYVELITNGKVLDTKRVVTILREDDTEEQVTLDPKANKAYQEQRNEATGKVTKIFNPRFGKYGVRVTIGPSYATKRIEAAESMMDFVRALPQTAQYIADLVAKNQDWPQAEQISARLAKLLPPNLLAPDMKDVPPQVQAIMQGMDAQVKDLTQKLAVASRELAERDKDRAIELHKAQQDFEAKMLKVVADVETKMAAVQERAVSNFNTHVGAQLKELGQGVTTLVQAMEHPAEAGTGE